nr:MAG TPA: hypothetical protein [Caudoviricetes sp.]
MLITKLATQIRKAKKELKTIIKVLSKFGKQSGRNGERNMDL